MCIYKLSILKTEEEATPATATIPTIEWIIVQEGKEGMEGIEATQTIELVLEEPSISPTINSLAECPKSRRTTFQKKKKKSHRHPCRYFCHGCKKKKSI
jgi:hypothetical protein